MLPDTHALRWAHAHKRVVLGYLQTTTVNWSGGWPRIEVKEEWIPPNPAMSASVLPRATQHRKVSSELRLGQTTGCINSASSQEDKAMKEKMPNPERSEGAFVRCVNLGFKHTWCQKIKIPTKCPNEQMLWPQHAIHHLRCFQRDFWEKFPSADSFSRPTHLSLGLLLTWLPRSQPDKWKPQRLNIEPRLITRRASFSFCPWTTAQSPKSGDSANRDSVLFLFSHIKKKTYIHHLITENSIRTYVKSERINIKGKLSFILSNKFPHMMWAVILSFCDVLKWERPLKRCSLQDLLIRWFPSLSSSLLLTRAVVTCSIYDNWFLKEKSKVDLQQNFARYASHLNALSLYHQATALTWSLTGEHCGYQAAQGHGVL